MRCGNCGSKDIIKKNVKGREFPYRDCLKLKLETDVELSVCNMCDNILMTGDDCKRLDEGLEPAYLVYKELK